jgi:hypothetical protein
MKRDVAISGDRNVIKKEAMKILKYKDLIIEIQCLWNVKVSDTSSNRSNWNHFKITQTNLSNISGKHKIKEVHKVAILGTAHLLRKVLM